MLDETGVAAAAGESRQSYIDGVSKSVGVAAEMPTQAQQLFWEAACRRQPASATTTARACDLVYEALSGLIVC